MNKTRTMSQRAAKDCLGTPEAFKGGCVVTKNGSAELYIQTADEREQEQRVIDAERQANALLKLAMMAKQDVATDRVHSKEAVLERLRAARS
ncbi:hypothetical protein [Vibrio sinaloensis]|uniref:hypothetical protein n=1 Tax=Photobacterium sp. (strain ATCC 43367) TaxID=379097 RepID=UPI00204836C0|nr:hypothetical protein [Vibrio sinaloensis]UPQ86917.1 hypothetical protein MTO69_07675 [Vibrio sinaloensis]